MAYREDLESIRSLELTVASEINMTTEFDVTFFLFQIVRLFQSDFSCCCFSSQKKTYSGRKASRHVKNTFLVSPLDSA